MNFKFLLISFVSVFIISACGKSSGDNPGQKEFRAHKVTWEKVPPQYSPEIEENSFRTDGYERLSVDVFGYKDDVELLYSSTMPANTVAIRMYRVFQKSASWGGYSTNTKGTQLNIQKVGQYQCSIRIQNGEITALEGGCYVRMTIMLPMNSTLEVENAGLLLSKRFIPLDVATFLEKIDREFWPAQKNAVIDDFLASYQATRRSPSMTTDQLQKVLHGYSRDEDKLVPLRRLWFFVTDRSALEKMIDWEFSFPDGKREARRIVGLPAR